MGHLSLKEPFTVSKSNVYELASNYQQEKYCNHFHDRHEVNKSIYYSVRLGFDFETWIRLNCLVVVMVGGEEGGLIFFSSILLYSYQSLHTEF